MIGIPIFGTQYTSGLNSHTTLGQWAIMVSGTVDWPFPCVCLGPTDLAEDRKSPKLYFAASITVASCQQSPSMPTRLRPGTPGVVHRGEAKRSVEDGRDPAGAWSRGSVAGGRTDSERWRRLGSRNVRDPDSSTHLGGNVRTKATARLIQADSSSSSAIPAGSIRAQPFMTLPVMSIGFTWGSDCVAS